MPIKLVFNDQSASHYPEIKLSKKEIQEIEQKKIIMRNNYFTIVKYLIENGADYNYHPKNQDSPLRIAKKYKQEKTVNFLTKLGAKEEMASKE